MFSVCSKEGSLKPRLMASASQHVMVFRLLRAARRCDLAGVLNWMPVTIMTTLP